ncbi:hypothetical protein CASFOL_008175 [Castilleja foliolosa]|uniref:Uncharacterized protein n=1 Tax=Castilleja foliolosa TaxID=1961234 RepID=A0ABD3DZX8_9LAMI
MASILFFIITIVYMLCMSPWPTFGSSVDDHQIYIVHVEEPDDAQLTSLNHQELQSYYTSFLSSVATTTTSSNDLNTAQDLIHSYRHVLHGFAAKLSTNDLKDLEKKEGFIAAFPEKILSLHTTHSPSFLGLNQNIGLWSGSNYGKGVIIGILDTGISPDHPSFSDDSMPSPPAKWKGKYCQLLSNFTSCNNKIIGAQSFVSMDNKTALDGNGHGTHTSSTAAGSFVKGANVYGNAEGTASGIAPGAHLAIYKVCDASGSCSDSAILAGMDAAIEDGVDVLSISLGDQTDYFYNYTIAIGAFSAMEKGIFVSASAGNDGPYFFSVSNDAPWILTVGASTMDRKLKATVMLGNNQQYDGESTFQPKSFLQKYLSLVYAGNCSSTDSLKRKGIRGKMVVCERGRGVIGEGEAVKEAGGAAMIVVNFEEWANTTSSIMKVLPAAHIGYADGLKIKEYMNSTKTPTAQILFGGTVIGDRRAPVVAGFSSRGPSYASPGILKPDILGPGVNILAAWPTSVENNPHSKSTFNIISGTSMSCPHLSGVAALLKSAHPDWSPAAIKSAIITTANILNHAHNPIEDETFVRAEIFATGAGHVNPEAAKDPGLIYDISPEDYIPYLCGLNYTNQQVQVITKKKVECSKANSIPEAQLNYPSFALKFTGKSTHSQTYSRTVTNVGDPQSSYNVTVVSPNGIQVNVIPQELTFSETNQNKQYNVTFSRLPSSPNNTAVKGFLKWCSSKQCVSSPIAVILV